MTYSSENPLFVLSNWIATTKRDWSKASLHAAKRTFIDLTACMIPGSLEEVTLKTLPLAQNWGTGNCTVVGHSAGLSAPMAAFVNGTAAHALDFDDDFDPAKCHPTAAILPALLALAEKENSSGYDLLDAYIVALEITGRVGQAINPYHRRRGWHATATIATIGATAGCARMLKLDETETKNALSASTSMAAGFMSQFGSMIKPMHAGLSAMRAVMAAEMGCAGITAGDQSFDGPYSLRTLMVGQDVGKLAKDMEGRDEYGQKSKFDLSELGNPLIIDQYGVKVKRFPNCGSVHRSLDNLLRLKIAHGFTADDITNIHVNAPIAHMRNIPYENPKTPLEAKFSLHYGLAVGLLYDTVTLDDFTETAIIRKEVTALYPLITRQGFDKLESECPTETIITLKDGTKLSDQTYSAVGSLSYPLEDQQIWNKFDRCTNQFHIRNEIKEFLRSVENVTNIQPFLKALASVERKEC